MWGAGATGRMSAGAVLTPGLCSLYDRGVDAPARCRAIEGFAVEGRGSSRMARANVGTPLGIGVIGCGTIANSAHLPAISRLGERLKLVAVADVREEQAARAAQKFGAGAYYTDYRELLARPDIAIVDVCTPEFLHREQIVAAAEAGKHILCEKPMADSLEAADAMIAAAERAGVKLMIGHSRRFTRRYREVRAAIDAGAVGPVRLVRENERRPRSMY